MKSKPKKDAKDSVKRMRAYPKLLRHCQIEMFFAFGLVYDQDEDTPQTATTPLHHYTNAQGLIGILESGVLHASNLKAVNDKGELEYGFRLIKEALSTKSEIPTKLAVSVANYLNIILSLLTPTRLSASSASL